MSHLEAIDPSTSPDPSPKTVAPRRGRIKHLLRVVGFLGLVSIVFVVGTLFGLGAGSVEPTHPDEFALIAGSWEVLFSDYVDAEHLDPSALAYGAISGMAYAVGDTGHTYFLTPEEAATAADLLSGSPGGIGASFDVMTDGQAISSLVPGGPAIIAGAEVGDRIVAVDGVPAEGPDAEDIMGRIFGTPGTAVVITVERPGRPDPFELRVTRADTGSEAPDWSMIPSTKVALVRLPIFSSGSGEELDSAVRAATKDGATGLILDLRGNRGGYLDEAVTVASVFLGPNTIVVREIDATGVETSEKTPSDSRANDLPLVVLVDQDSWSSSEVVAGALQDAQRATIVGTRTGGTGTIPIDYFYPDGSDLVIGILRWLTPSGRSIWHVGLMPDIVIELPGAAIALTPDTLVDLTAKKLAKSNDVQLLRAIELLTDR